MKLAKLSILSTLILSGTSISYAASNAVPIGSNLGYGGASNNHTIFSTSNNPAWISGNLHEENNYGFGLTGGIRLKQNDLSELYTTYDDDIKPLLESFDGSSQNSLSKTIEIQQLTNNLILDIRDNFYLQSDVNFSVPIAIANSRFGGIGIEVSGSSTARGKLLSSNKPIDTNIAYLLSHPTASFEDIVENGLVIQSALYLKTAVSTEAALTYGNQFYQNQYGQLSVGLRAKYMQSKLVKSVNNLDKYLTSTATGNELSDQISDDFEAHSDVSDTESSFGVDLGAQWFAENYMVGLSIMNINSPTFNYNKLATGSDTQSNVENFYADQIDLKEEVVLTPQARIEGILYSENRNWSLAGSIDLNVANDYVNQEYQWATASASFATDGGSSWFYYLIPDVRIGYHKNLAGDERSYISPGFSWGFLNLDLGFASFSDIGKAASGDPEDLPEAFMANLGVEFYF